MYPLTQGERIVSCQSLVCFLQGITGQEVIVELKDEVAVEGVLANCDCNMTLTIKDATVYRRRVKGAKPTQVDEVALLRRSIRFVHPTQRLDVIPVIRKSIKHLVGQKKGKNNY